MNPKNAVIRDYWLRISEQYSMSLELCLELDLQDGGGVVFSVWGPYSGDFHKNTFAYSVKRIMDICGVTNLKDLKGAPIRAKFEGNGQLGDAIIGIGNFLYDDWFIPREEKLYKDF